MRRAGGNPTGFALGLNWRITHGIHAPLALLRPEAMQDRELRRTRGEQGMIKNFKNEISWDGILAAVAILGLVGGVAVYAVETHIAAVTAQKTAETVQSHQGEQDAHLAKIDNAITMIATVLQERTGKMIVLPDQQIAKDPK
jgi:hypothetical protein